MRRTALAIVLLGLFPNVSSAEEHAFWDKRGIVGTSVHVAARTIDVHSSCRMLQRGYSEVRLPFKSCKAIGIYSYGAVGAELFVRYLLHKRGHHVIERLSPYVFAAPAGIEAGFNYRF